MAIIRQGNPKNIAIHHSAVNPPAQNLAELKVRATSHDNFHKTKSIQWNNTTLGEYGYKYIRYHYMIAQDGAILQVQDEKYALYHSGDGTKGAFNYYGIAIMFEGNYDIAQPTEAMMKSAVKLIRKFEKRYKVDPKVRGHKEISSSPTACPGGNLGTSKSGWIKQLITNVNDPNYSTEIIQPPVDECTSIKQELEALRIEYTALQTRLNMLLEQQVEWEKEREELLKIKELVKKLSTTLNEMDKVE